MERYAIYFAPQAGSALAEFGANWLGWDAEVGQSVTRNPVPGIAAEELDRFTQAPRRYGFHGTLKPPFRLAEGTSFEDLQAAAVQLAHRLSPVDMGRFRMKRLGGFLALVPQEKSVELQGLAARCVTELDHFRAPAPPDETARRRKRGLSPRQDDYLLKWGYPYVLEEFRFHLTLTGSLEESDLARVEDHLAGVLDPILRETVSLSDLCIFGDPGDGQSCRIVQRISVGGA
ncbi:DUF1045 domain-containing protein [Hwanghaeella grinnelliae]|uniref:DUF1045 domain-containing protein n=1 Tax=Hwanghaeella grinnelliae TaxID=2500179 RepID=A0A3S2Y1N9_9PROT|nr:DUF1045 domain-containing protein [Hwanghaeella grinnelliae]RVU35163.1 DUF1045 domain-containing protein [Hwanghaeella grinnelliae]